MAQRRRLEPIGTSSGERAVEFVPLAAPPIPPEERGVRFILLAPFTVSESEKTLLSSAQRIAAQRRRLRMQHPISECPPNRRPLQRLVERNRAKRGS